MTDTIKNLTIKNARTLLKSGELSARELVEGYLEEISKENKDLNAYLEVFTDVIAQAEKVDKGKLVADDNLPLAGIPLAIKDNILIAGRKVSAASRMLENYTATYDATVTRKLRQAGAVFLGRTNMDEFAMGGSTENSAYGPVKNPYDHNRVAGGSSGGSAAAVASNMALVAIGSDTGGSVRQPASFCGVVGLKPTYGTVSRHGLIAMASSLDQIGPFGRTIDDAEILYDVIAGRDSLDSTTTEKEEIKSPKKLVVGVPYDFLNTGLDPEVKDNFTATVSKLKTAGCEIREVSLPNVKYALACYYIIMPAEASSNLARFDGVKYGLKVNGEDLTQDYFRTRGIGFGSEVRRRIILGTYVLSAGYYDAYYSKAIGVRALISEDYKKVFAGGVHTILTPTAPSPAFLIGEKTSDPLQMYLEDIFTVPANLTGLPALSVPSGRTQSGLPLGVQFTAPHFSERTLFQVGRIIENH